MHAASYAQPRMCADRLHVPRERYIAEQVERRLGKKRAEEAQAAAKAEAHDKQQEADLYEIPKHLMVRPLGAACILLYHMAPQPAEVLVMNAGAADCPPRRERTHDGHPRDPAVCGDQDAQHRGHRGRQAPPAGVALQLSQQASCVRAAAQSCQVQHSVTLCCWRTGL